jgi:hypothetical protein
MDTINRGAIWKNEKPSDKQNPPDFTGSLNADGVEYHVNAWRKRADASPKAPALSFTIRRKEAAFSAKSDLDF